MDGEKNKRIRLLVSTFLFCLKFSSYSFCIIVSRYPSRHCSPFSTVYALISHSNVWVWESVFLVCFLNVATFRVRLMYCNIFFFHFILYVWFLCVFFSLSQVVSTIIWTCTLYGVRFEHYYRKKWRIHEQRQINAQRVLQTTHSTMPYGYAFYNIIWECRNVNQTSLIF